MWLIDCWIAKKLMLICSVGSVKFRKCVFFHQISNSLHVFFVLCFFLTLSVSKFFFFFRKKKTMPLALQMSNDPNWDPSKKNVVCTNAKDPNWDI